MINIVKVFVVHATCVDSFDGHWGFAQWWLSMFHWGSWTQMPTRKASWMPSGAFHAVTDVRRAKWGNGSVANGCVLSIWQGWDVEMLVCDCLWIWMNVICILLTIYPYSDIIYTKYHIVSVLLSHKREEIGGVVFYFQWVHACRSLSFASMMPWTSSKKLPKGAKRCGGYPNSWIFLDFFGGKIPI